MRQASNDPAANTVWNTDVCDHQNCSTYYSQSLSQSVDRLYSGDNQSNGESLSSGQKQAKSQESDIKNGGQGSKPENGIVRATSQKTKNMVVIQGQSKISQSKQTDPKDTPAMIVLRKASQIYNKISSSQRSSNFQRTKSDSPPKEEQDTTSEEESSTNKEPIRLLMKSYSNKIPRRNSVAGTALTLVNAHATLVGSDYAPSNIAERRNSTMAVIVTEQGSHEIIWQFDDTPSSCSSSTGSQRQGQRNGDTIQQPRRSEIRV